jgi:hypothetical protein
MVPIHFDDVTVESAECIWLAKYLDDKDRESDPEYDGPQVADFIEFYEPLLKLEGVDEKILLRNFEWQYNVKIDFMNINPNALTPALNEIKLMDIATAFNESRIDANLYGDILFAYEGMTCGVGKPEVVSKEQYLEDNPNEAYRFNPHDAGTHFVAVSIEECVQDDESGWLNIVDKGNIPIQDFENRYGKSLLQLNKEVKEKLEKYGPDILRMPLSKYANGWLRSYYHIKLVDQSLCYEVADYNAGFHRVDDVVSIQAENGKDVLYVEITNLATDQGIALPLSEFLEDFKFTCNHIDRKLDDQIIMQLLAMDEAYDYNVENEIE